MKTAFSTQEKSQLSGYATRREEKQKVEVKDGGGGWRRKKSGGTERNGETRVKTGGEKQLSLN